MRKNTWIIVLVGVVLLALMIMKCSRSPSEDAETSGTKQEATNKSRTESSSETGSTKEQPKGGKESADKEAAAENAGESATGSQDGASGKGGGAEAGSADGSAGAGGAGDNSGSGGKPGEKAAGSAGAGSAGSDGGGSASGGAGNASGNLGGAPPADSDNPPDWVDVVEETPGGSIAIVYPRAPAVAQPPDLDALKLDAQDPRRELIGVWSQSAGPSDADFAHGGYTQTAIIFTTAGRIEVTRFYGAVDAEGTSGTRALTRSLQLDYVIKDGRITFSVPSKKSAPDRRELNLVDSKGKTWKATAPKALPLTSRYELKGDTLTIDGKTYRRVAPSK